jgi:hypothetical protein
VFGFKRECTCINVYYSRQQEDWRVGVEDQHSLQYLGGFDIEERERQGKKRIGRSGIG